MNRCAALSPAVVADTRHDKESLIRCAALSPAVVADTRHDK